MQIVIQTMYTFKYSYCSEKKSEKKKKECFSNHANKELLNPETLWACDGKWWWVWVFISI